MTSERKVYFGESIGIEDTQLHHLSPRGTNGMARPQRFAFFRKAIANHLKPERRDHGDSLAATALQVLGHTQMKQVLIEVCHDHPICLLSALFPDFIGQCLFRKSKGVWITTGERPNVDSWM